MRIQALVNISNTTFDSVQFLPKTLIYNISAFAHTICGKLVLVFNFLPVNLALGS